MQLLRVNLGPRSYDLAIGTGTEVTFPTFVRDRLAHSARALVVCDENTRTHADRLAERLGVGSVAVVPAGEGSKSLAGAADLYSRLAEIAADRKTPVLAIGGGVVGDLAGFVAATYNRGLPLLMVPTTLLAMVDSAVGGKVGINLPEGKNLVGAFHQPVGVWIDTALLDTLPDREYRSGLAEVVKYGVILDSKFFDWLEANADSVVKRDPVAMRHIVTRSCSLKAEVVERDEREETGLRMALNYGHTFAHAFESVGGYGTWLHGEAVAAGMICASRLAVLRGLIRPDATVRQRTLLTQFGLPTAPLTAWSADALLDAMRRDKKAAAGQLRFILPVRLGEVRLFDEATEADVRAVLTS